MTAGANAFFKTGDPVVRELAGYRLPEDWWSRPYEYAWALQYAEPGQVAADMGCGWMYRPFKDALAKRCQYVYAVDADIRLLKQAEPPNAAFIVADFTRPIVGIPAASLDRVFCISVLEDLGDALAGAMKTFAYHLKPDGLVVATFDVQHDPGRPAGRYPGVDFDQLVEAVGAAGLAFAGDIDPDLNNAISHTGFNLACFHMVLRHA